MRRNKTILDVLREAQTPPGKQGTGLFKQQREPDRETSKKGQKKAQGDERSATLWLGLKGWFLKNPALGGGLTLGFLFLLVFGWVQWKGAHRLGGTGEGIAVDGPGKTAQDPLVKKGGFQAKSSGTGSELGKAPQLMGGEKFVPPVKPASNLAARSKSKLARGRAGKLKPETWTKRQLRFFRISSYKNPKKAVIGYASSMARYLRKLGFSAEHAWLKTKGTKLLIVFVRIPEGTSPGGEEKLFSKLKSLGFVKKPKDKTDDGFQFNFRTLKKNIGRASFRVRVGGRERG